MANGKQHDMGASVTLFAGTVIAAASLAPLLAACAVAGLVLGRYANPDVRDQEQVRNHGERLVAQDFGRLAGALWSAYWWPLAKLIPHRSPFSHLPVFATVIAFLWLFVPMLAFAWWITGVDMQLGTWLVMWLTSRYGLAILAAWSVQDVVHLIQDKFGIRWK